MALTLNVGQQVQLSLSYLDQNGQPMTVMPDSPPSWSAGNPATDALTVVADGSSAIDVALAAGTDTVGVTVVVGGRSFAASLALTVAPPPQVLTSVEIVAGTPEAAAAPAPVVEPAPAPAANL